MRLAELKEWLAYWLPTIVLGTVIAGLVIFTGFPQKLATWSRQEYDRWQNRQEVFKPQPIPSNPNYNFVVGDLLTGQYGGLIEVCQTIEKAKVNNPSYCTYNKVVKVVKVVGPIKEFSTGKYWEVETVQGHSIYDEAPLQDSLGAIKEWICDCEQFQKISRVPVPTKPNVKPGDHVILNSGFLVHSGPCEGPKYPPSHGPVTANNGVSAIILDGPQLCENHWWCNIRVTTDDSNRADQYFYGYQLGLEGWIYCEVTKETS